MIFYPCTTAALLETDTRRGLCGSPRAACKKWASPSGEFQALKRPMMTACTLQYLAFRPVDPRAGLAFPGQQGEVLPVIEHPVPQEARRRILLACCDQHATCRKMCFREPCLTELRKCHLLARFCLSGRWGQRECLHFVFFPLRQIRFNMGDLAWLQRIKFPHGSIIADVFSPFRTDRRLRPFVNTSRVIFLARLNSWKSQVCGTMYRF